MPTGAIVEGLMGEEDRRPSLGRGLRSWGVDLRGMEPQNENLPSCHLWTRAPVEIKYVSFLDVGSKGQIMSVGRGTPSISSFGPHLGQFCPEQNTLSGLARGNPMGGGFVFDV